VSPLLGAEQVFSRFQPFVFALQPAEFLQPLFDPLDNERQAVLIGEIVGELFELRFELRQPGMQFADGDASLRDRIEELLQRDRQTAERMRTAGQQNAEA